MGHLVLINPWSENTYQDLDDLTAIEPPLWARLIAGYVRDKGHQVSIIDAEAERLSYAQVAAKTSTMQPDLISVLAYGHQPSASTQQMHPAGEVCKAVRSIAPVILAGGHVSVLPERTLKEESVDYVAIGEGAVTIEQLLSGKEYVHGLAYRTDAGIIKNTPAALLKADDLHGDTWDLLPMQKYRAHNWHANERKPYASIYTSLGCPFKCVFCCINAPFGGPGYRVRSPESVVAEIVHLHDHYGVEAFKITDEMFVLKPSHYLPICETLAQLPFADDLNLWAYARIDTVRPETLTVLRKAGIRWLALGIESASNTVRDGAEKSFGDKDISQVVKSIQRAGIKVIGNFIFGLPEDTFGTMCDTLDLAFDLQCDFVNFYSAMAYPGSGLFAGASQADLPVSWSGYSQHSYDCKPLSSKNLTSPEILQFRDYAHGLYFHSDPVLAKRLKRKLA